MFLPEGEPGHFSSSPRLTAWNVLWAQSSGGTGDQLPGTNACSPHLGGGGQGGGSDPGPVAGRGNASQCAPRNTDSRAPPLSQMQLIRWRHGLGICILATARIQVHTCLRAPVASVLTAMDRYMNRYQAAACRKCPEPSDAGGVLPTVVLRMGHGHGGGQGEIMGREHSPRQRKDQGLRSRSGGWVEGQAGAGWRVRRGLGGGSGGGWVEGGGCGPLSGGR